MALLIILVGQVLWSYIRGMGRLPSEPLSGRKAMEWFSRKTSIAGIQISNWILVLVAIIVIWIIYSFISH